MNQPPKKPIPVLAVDPIQLENYIAAVQELITDGLMPYKISHCKLPDCPRCMQAMKLVNRVANRHQLLLNGAKALAEQYRELVSKNPSKPGQ